jgi:hypothetical protein
MLEKKKKITPGDQESSEDSAVEDRMMKVHSF